MSVRAWLSMMFAQLVDTIIFVSIAFYGVVPLWPLIVGQYLIKIVIVTVGTPLVSLSVSVGRSYIADGAQTEIMMPKKDQL